MIEFLIGVLPFVVCVLTARRLAHQGIRGRSRFSAQRQPTAVQQTSTTPDPPALIVPVASIQDTDVRDVTPTAWTALDDLQLDRLLNEASS